MENIFLKCYKIWSKISKFLGSVIKYMAGNLEMEDEDKFQSSLNQLINQFPRYR